MKTIAFARLCHCIQTQKYIYLPICCVFMPFPYSLFYRRMYRIKQARSTRIALNDPTTSTHTHSVTKNWWNEANERCKRGTHSAHRCQFFKWNEETFYFPFHSLSSLVFHKKIFGKYIKERVHCTRNPVYRHIRFLYDFFSFFSASIIEYYIYFLFVYAALSSGLISLHSLNEYVVFVLAACVWCDAFIVHPSFSFR